jgi:Asp-tRNA(Asn)/Glu-tRNA(Gln) amidotransferase A subunit family amidase
MARHGADFVIACCISVALGGCAQYWNSPLSLARHHADSSRLAGSLLADVDVAAVREHLRDADASCHALIATVLEKSRLADLDGVDRLGIHALISVNPDALIEADRLDASRRAGGTLGSAHCLPVVVKDNIDTVAMPTTGGSPLFAGWHPPKDAAVVARLRRAGAIIVGKANLDDFAAAVYGISSIVGATRNPYAPALTVGGSSGGSAAAVAAGYVPLAIGTDAGGSLRIPASFTGTVTIRPTVGLVSAGGIMPRGSSQDTAGPIARTVRDAAFGLDLIADEPLTPGTGDAPRATYASHALGASLRGARIGIVYEGLALFGGTDRGVRGLLDRAVADMTAAGAEMVPIEPPDPALLAESSVISEESRRDMDAYLAAEGDTAPVHDFAALVRSRAFTSHAGASFERELTVDPASLDANPRYRRALAARRTLATWTTRLMSRERLDAIAYASTTRPPRPIGVEQDGVFTRWSENTGFPAIAVPMGLAPSDDDPGGPRLPANIEWLGRPHDEGRLIGIAAAYEQATHRREAPPAR